MVIKNPKLTARAAADEFAATHWEKRRYIGQWDNRNGVFWFKLEDGVKWYKVLPFGVIGWEVVDAE